MVKVNGEFSVMSPWFELVPPVLGNNQARVGVLESGLVDDSAITLWSEEPLVQVQTTVSPTFALEVAGEKKSLPTDMLTVAPWTKSGKPKTSDDAAKAVLKDFLK